MDTGASDVGIGAEPWAVEVDQPAQLYERYAPELIRFAAGLVGRDQARDVVASAMARCLFGRARPTLRNPRAYLYRAVYHESISVQRQFTRGLRLVSRLGAERPPEPRGDHADDRLTDAVAGLSPRQRAVVVLTYWQDLEPPAIAEHLGISEGAVRKHLARARQNLRKVMSHE